MLLSLLLLLLLLLLFLPAEYYFRHYSINTLCKSSWLYWKWIDKFIWSCD